MDNVFIQEGVSYPATLPISWRKESNPGADELATWMYANVTLLRALASIEAMQPEKEGELGSGAGKVLERLEFKIDLALNLISQLLAQNTSAPPACPALVSAKSVEWICQGAPAQDEDILISLYISPKLPQPLTLPAKVIAVRNEEGASRIYATFTHLSDEAKDWLTRTVFRHHRRAIQNLHHD